MQEVKDRYLFQCSFVLKKYLIQLKILKNRDESKSDFLNL